MLKAVLNEAWKLAPCRVVVVHIDGDEKDGRNIWRKISKIKKRKRLDPG